MGENERAFWRLSGRFGVLAVPLPSVCIDPHWHTSVQSVVESFHWPCWAHCRTRTNCAAELLMRIFLERQDCARANGNRLESFNHWRAAHSTKLFSQIIAADHTFRFSQSRSINHFLCRWASDWVGKCARDVSCQWKIELRGKTVHWRTLQCVNKCKVPYAVKFAIHTCLSAIIEWTRWQGSLYGTANKLAASRAKEWIKDINEKKIVCVVVLCFLFFPVG